MKKYYALETEGSTASITIYGDITSWPWLESDVSAYLLSKQINGIEADVIEVYIDSYGGEVSEGLAIYNALKRHPAKVKTYCDGFACSAASVVFMAGDERIMGDASLLMIHNAWTFASGNAAELRKVADDLDTISEASANAYKAAVNIEEGKLAELMENETWILPADAVEMGFATGIETYRQSDVPAANARLIVFEKMQKEDFLELDAREAEALIDMETAKVIAKTAAKETAEEIVLHLKTPQNPSSGGQENKVKNFLMAYAAREGEKQNEK